MFRAGGQPNQSTEDGSDFRQLVELARQGDRGAREAIFGDCRDYLLLVANHDMDERLRTTHAASDFVQAALVRANEKLPQFRGECRQELLGWVRTILKNEMRGTVRKELATGRRELRGQPASSWLTGSAAHPIDPQHTPASELQLEEEARQLRECILRLTDDYREVLLLRNWQRLSFMEIASHMERSENAVKKLWARALVALERELKSWR